MKNLTIIILFFFIACEPKEKVVAPPENIKTIFATTYPGISPTWEQQQGNFEATFQLNNVATSVVYNPDGKLVETESGIDPQLLPEAVKQYVKTMQGSLAKIDEAAKIILADGTLQYEAEVNGKDLLFDADGNFIK